MHDLQNLRAAKAGRNGIPPLPQRVFDSGRHPSKQDNHSSDPTMGRNANVAMASAVEEAKAGSSQASSYIGCGNDEEIAETAGHSGNAKSLSQKRKKP